MTHRADQLLAPSFRLRFIGVGNSHATELGSSSAVVERGGGPLLLIDCGPDVLPRYLAEYGGQLPGAIFVTHAHLDHIGGLENLFYRVFKQDSSVKTRLFVPIRLVEILQQLRAERLEHCSHLPEPFGARDSGETTGQFVAERLDENAERLLVLEGPGGPVRRIQVTR